MGHAARRALVGLGVATAAAGAAMAIPAVRRGIATVVALLLAGDIEGLRAYLLGFGGWAPAVSALLMIGQSIVAPLPAFVITLTNGLLFGPFWGALLSWSSAMVGAWLCFWIARWLGRPAAEQLVGKTALESADAFFQRYGVQAIVIARLLPFVPFDPISYAAGLTLMSARRFLLGTGLGQLPGTALYSYFGAKASNAAEILFGVFAAAGAAYLIGRLVRRRRAGPSGVARSAASRAAATPPAERGGGA